VTPSARSWRAYPQAYRLEAALCTKRRRTFSPPRLVYNTSGYREFETFAMTRTETVVTYTVIRTPGDQYQGEAPSAVGIIQMEDGPRLTTQIVDVGLDEITIGMTVKLESRRFYAEGHDGIVDFCPSCGARRMVETAARLVDTVLPRVGYRQWVVSVPTRVHWYLKHEPAALDGLAAVFLRLVESALRQASPGAPRDARSGAVLLVHRFGDALNSHRHSGSTSTC